MSKYKGVEMGMYYVDGYGYYFERSSGYVKIPYYKNQLNDDFWTFIPSDDLYNYYYGENNFSNSYRYSMNPGNNDLYIPNGMGSLQNMGRPTYYYHTHPRNSYLSTPDIRHMLQMGFPIIAIGWDGVFRGEDPGFSIPGVDIIY